VHCCRVRLVMTGDRGIGGTVAVRTTERAGSPDTPRRVARVVEIVARVILLVAAIAGASGSRRNLCPVSTHLGVGMVVA